MTFDTIRAALAGWLDGKFSSVLSAIVLFALGWFLIGLLIKGFSKALKKSKIDITLHTFMKSLVRISLIVLLAITIAPMLGIPSTSLVTALGAVGLALSLAVKDGLANLAGGLVLLTTKPFVVGDYIEAEGVGGTVAKIDLVHTMLRTIDNKEIFIPNGQMSNAKVVNYSAEPLRRLDLEFQIGYHDDLDAAKALVAEIVARHPLALKEPAPFLRLSKLGQSAVTLTSRVWVASGDYWELNFDLLEQVKAAFDETGIHIPYNQLDVHVSENA